MGTPKEEGMQTWYLLRQKIEGFAQEFTFTGSSRPSAQYAPKGFVVDRVVPVGLGGRRHVEIRWFLVRGRYNGGMP